MPQVQGQGQEVQRRSKPQALGCGEVEGHQDREAMWCRGEERILQTLKARQQRDSKDNFRDVVKGIKEKEGREVKSRNARSIRKESLIHKEREVKKFKEFLENYDVYLDEVPPFSNISQQKDITNTETDTEVYDTKGDKLKKVKKKDIEIGQG